MYENRFKEVEVRQKMAFNFKGYLKCGPGL